jgi:hypothetical protein
MARKLGYSIVSAAWLASIFMVATPASALQEQQKSTTRQAFVRADGALDPELLKILKECGIDPAALLPGASPGGQDQPRTLRCTRKPVDKPAQPPKP